MAAPKVKFGEYVATTPKTKPIEAKAIVHFRPHSGWKGEFGFDWMRVEDTKIDGDVDYKKNVGSYGKVYATKKGAVFTAGKYPSLENEYAPKTIVEKKDAAGKPKKYYTSLLSLYKDPNVATNPKAKLELLIEVEEEPDELYVEFPKAFFEIAGSTISKDDKKLKHFKISKKSVTKKIPHKLDIEIECVDTPESDKNLTVWAVKNKEDGTTGTPKLAGQLKIKANGKSHRRISKIVFVSVVTNIKGTKKGEKEGITDAKKISQETYLKPFLQQALIKPEVELEPLKLHDINKPEVKTLNKHYTLTKDGVKIFSKYHTTSGSGLINFLTTQFNAIAANAKYKDYYKVFFIDEGGGRKDKKSGNIIGLGGHANGIGSKECIMYTKPKKFFVAHELMHCMGLYHSFDNKGKHTFKLGQTENIMDYSHISKYAKPNGTLTQISTWAWQWPTLKSKNEKEV